MIPMTRLLMLIMLDNKGFFRNDACLLLMFGDDLEKAGLQRGRLLVCFSIVCLIAARFVEQIQSFPSKTLFVLCFVIFPTTRCACNTSKELAVIRIRNESWERNARGTCSEMTCPARLDCEVEECLFCVSCEVRAMVVCLWRL